MTNEQEQDSHLDQMKAILDEIPPGELYSAMQVIRRSWLKSGKLPTLRTDELRQMAFESLLTYWEKVEANDRRTFMIALKRHATWRLKNYRTRRSRRTAGEETVTAEENPGFRTDNLTQYLRREDPRSPFMAEAMFQLEEEDPKASEILDLSILEGYTLSEIAEIFHRSLRSIKRDKKNALERLTELYESIESGEE